MTAAPFLLLLCFTTLQYIAYAWLLIPLYCGEAGSLELALCNAWPLPYFPCFEAISEDDKGGVGASADSGKLFQWKTQHQTAGGLVANVETAWPSMAAVATAPSEPVCKSTGSLLRDNQNGSGGGFNYYHFRPVVAVKGPENRTVKGFSVRNFRCPYTLTLSGTWRRRRKNWLLSIYSGISLIQSSRGTGK